MAKKIIEVECDDLHFAVGMKLLVVAPPQLARNLVSDASL